MKRKDALTRLNSLLVPVLKHLDKLRDRQSEFDFDHWHWESTNWILQMEKVLPYVGRKTAAEWQQRLEELKVRKEDLDER